MGLLSGSSSFARYKINGPIAEPLVETVRQALAQNTVEDIDNKPEEKTLGWASFEKPFVQDMTQADIVIGHYLVFSLRMDKKTLPARVLRQHAMQETQKRLAASGREFLSKQEKEEVKEQVTKRLFVRLPPVPYFFDVLWNMDTGIVIFFSTQKAAREAFESLFFKSFGVTLIPLYPFTWAQVSAGLDEDELLELEKLVPAPFVE
ncbi:MAG: recombination-associated protein RdgC [Desulfatibacillaceae bacterium]|nr:recombination-associated protein RdgC [Desulfatibacillaceae bacterium]